MIQFKEILLPTDFGNLSKHAARFATSLARAFGARLHVVHAYQPLVPALDIGAAAPEAALEAGGPHGLLNQFVEAEINDHNFPFVVILRPGPPVKVVTEYAAEAAIDLIVIGTHARGLINRVLAGSLSKAILKHAGCLVMMVPHKASMPEVADSAAESPTEHGIYHDTQ